MYLIQVDGVDSTMIEEIKQIAQMALKPCDCIDRCFCSSDKERALRNILTLTEGKDIHPAKVKKQIDLKVCLRHAHNATNKIRTVKSEGYGRCEIAKCQRGHDFVITIERLVELGRN